MTSELPPNSHSPIRLSNDAYARNHTRQPYHQVEDDHRAISPSSSPLIPQHSSIAMPEPGYDEEEARHDQESMRRANSEVQYMQQQQQMDGQSLFLTSFYKSRLS